MRELQNVSLVLLTLTLGVVFISLQGCASNNIELLDGLCFNDKDGTYICDPKPVEVLEPKPVMPAPGVEPCWQIERYHFDTPGVDPHEVKTPKKCEGLLS